jgi:hypothetical protein
MTRSWSTFKPKNSWNSLQNKPAILSDNQISWNEIINKPTTFPATPPIGIEFQEHSFNYIDFHCQGIGNPSVDFDARIFVGAAQWRASGTSSIFYQAFSHYFYGSIIIPVIPSSPSGLIAGQLWRDANGFVKVVI